ncbi:hypothetical protein J3R30DRAFT_2123034 [Lentinula aciculospora]|uniref:Uncharacterized protein n=1 Tax=Lentinula aciculospora TaxID=153920 RepID=A0A9W9AHL0_9AGAR|nr:hypothetical protein J3R30DRAFT_2123034 [Lentinula aciculospora]
MDNNNDGNSGQQRSTLPRSLIPHLYSAPQTSRDSSTRTTLPEPEEEDPDFQQQQRSFSPFALRPLSSEHPSQSPPLASRRYPTYDHPVQPSSEPPEMRLPHTVPPIPNDPPFYISRPAPIYSYPQMEIQQPFASSWRVGEAGPSSGVVHRSHSYPQRGYHYMDIQYTQHQQHQPQHRQSYSSQGGHYSDYNAYTQGHTLTSDSLLSPHQAHRQIPEHMYSGDPSRAVTQDLYTLPPHSQLSGSSSQSSIARGWYPTSTASSSNTIANRASSSYSSLPLHQSAEYLTEPDDDDGEYLPPGRRNQKRKLESSEQEFGSRPKKTLIACDFCRGS